MREHATENAEVQLPTAGSAMKTGAGVFLLLALFTIVEYVIAIEVESNLVPLFVIAAVKAGLILWFFMHLSRSWRGGHA